MTCAQGRIRHGELTQFATPTTSKNAAKPNQVWTWNISKLATVVKRVFLNLYVVIDLFSRYVVGWMVAEHENGALAEQSLPRRSVATVSNPARCTTPNDSYGALRLCAYRQSRVEINPLDPGDTMTASALLSARDAQLSSSAATTARPSTVPVISLPGVLNANPGAAPPLTLCT